MMQGEFWIESYKNEGKKEREKYRTKETNGQLQSAQFGIHRLPKC